MGESGKRTPKGKGQRGGGGAGVFVGARRQGARGLGVPGGRTGNQSG